MDTTLATLQEQWIKAKHAEEAWKAHRLQTEEKIQEMLELPEKGSVKLDRLTIRTGNTRTWNQPKLAALLARDPSLVGTMFKVTYSPISNPAIDKADSQEIQETYQDKPRKAAFSENK